MIIEKQDKAKSNPCTIVLMRTSYFLQRFGLHHSHRSSSSSFRFLCTSSPPSLLDSKAPQHQQQQQPECDRHRIPLIGTHFQPRRLSSASSCSRRSVLLGWISLDSNRARPLLNHHYAFHRGMFLFEFAFPF